MTLETASVRLHELPWRDVMKNLQDQVGKRVSIHYASDGSQGIIRGVLTEVKPFKNVKVDDFEIPFIGKGAAIQRIMGQEILYHIPYISERYSERREEEIKRLRRFVFQGEDREAEESLAI